MHRDFVSVDRRTLFENLSPIMVVFLLLAGATFLFSPATPVTSAQTCGKSSNYLAIWEIQGSGHRSPYEGQKVSDVRGVVTADFQRGSGGPWELRGFFMQAHETDCDGATSEGIFVYTGSTAKDVMVGDLIVVDRTEVAEYQGPSSFQWERTLTQLDCRSGCSTGQLQSGYGLPAPLEYDPPEDDAASVDYNESREGMLAQVSIDSTVVAAANQYNELVMLRGTGHDRLHRDDPPHGHKIMLNGDGISSAKCGTDGLGAIKTFDTIHYDPQNGYTAYGPVNYGFNNYKIQQEPDQYCLRHSAGDDSSYNPANHPAPAADGDTLTVASLNTWNFFDTADDSEKNDEVLTQAEMDHHSAKLADAVCNGQGLNQPLVVALQEIENDTVLQKLVGDIANLCGVTYDYHTLAGPDDRSIEVGFITRSDRVNVLSVNARQGCSDTDWGIDYEPSDQPAAISCTDPEPHYLFNRPPLEISAEIQLGGQVRTLYFISNHFKSKLGNATCTIDDCTDWRVEQAQWVDSLVASRLADDPNALITVLGDLNDFYHSDPLTILTEPEGQLVNTWQDLYAGPSTTQGKIQRYSYIYNGVSQTLDHLLISPALDALQRELSPRHINPDWPASLRDDTSMFRSSDHDPLLAGFTFASSGDATPSASIVEPVDGSTITGTVAILVDATDTEDSAGSLNVEVAIDGGAWQPASYNSTSGYYELSWDTTTVADGSHTIDARATDSAGNIGRATTVTVSVSNGTAGATMHVEAIDFDVVVHRGKVRTYDVTGLVTILDEAGNPVPNAEVLVEWSDARSGTETIYTDSNGVATTSTQTDLVSGERICLDVLDATHAEFQYDPSQNVETQDCITL